MSRIHRYDSPIPAHQAAEFLRSRGIPAEVVGDTDAFGGMGRALGMGVYEVVTLRREDADRARQLLQEQPAPVDPGSGGAPLPDLSRLHPEMAPGCPGCGEALPLDSEISACPACGAPVDVAALIVAAFGPEALEPCYDGDAAEALPPAAAPPPRVCALCGYSLKGLGAQGRCPECGALFPQRLGD